jgi:hypothetical protein
LIEWSDEALLHLEVVLDKRLDDLIDAVSAVKPRSSARGAPSACGQPETIC